MHPECHGRINVIRFVMNLMKVPENAPMGNPMHEVSQEIFNNECSEELGSPAPVRERVRKSEDLKFGSENFQVIKKDNGHDESDDRAQY
jgi:hypothetical protein